MQALFAWKWCLRSINESLRSFCFRLLEFNFKRIYKINAICFTIRNYCMVVTVYGYNSVSWSMLSMKYEQGLSLYIYCLQDHVQMTLQTITPHNAWVFIWLYRQIIIFLDCKFLLVHKNLCALLEAFSFLQTLENINVSHIWTEHIYSVTQISL